MTYFKRGIAAVLCVGILVAGTNRAEAQTTYAQANQIAVLQALVMQLQIQLAQLIANQNGGTIPSSSSVADVSVTTDEVSSNYNTVEFSGTVSFNHDDEATVWFEYGPTSYLTYSTPAQELRQSRGTKRFTMFGDAVRPGAFTYFRAAAQDSNGDIAYGSTRTFVAGSRVNDYNDHDYNDDDDDDNDNFDQPDVDTDEAEDIYDDSAELRGQIDMNDGEDGEVFFVYGEDEDQVNDVEDEDQYSDVDTDGDDLQKVIINASFDGDDDFARTVYNLDEDTDIYYRLCVGYENDDDDDELICGDVESFTTDNN